MKITVLYFDNGELFIVNSTLTDNKALNSSEPVYALYLNDAVAKIENSTIDNGEFNIYGNFVKSYESLNNALDEGSVSIDNQNYIYYVENTGVVLNLTNNLLILKNILPDSICAKWIWILLLNIRE